VLDKTIENVKENRIIDLKFRFPAPISSDTKRSVDTKILPLARTIMNPKTVVISVITPTAAVPSVFVSKILRSRPSPFNIKEIVESLIVSIAIPVFRIPNINIPPHNFTSDSHKIFVNNKFLIERQHI
jgi:hypothetical protein